MSVTSQKELSGLKKAAEAVALTLCAMREYAYPGMSTKHLDEYGGTILKKYGARSAPNLLYGFPGYTCISVNRDIAHGIPSDEICLQEGDLINIDVSAELKGFYSDNGCSFVLGSDIRNLQPLVDASKRALKMAVAQAKTGLRIAHIGRVIEQEAKRSGYSVIRNLVGHGIGRKLHESPHEIPCFYDKYNFSRFGKNAAVAIETFVSTKASIAVEKGDGWTYTTKDQSYVAQHEHTIIVTENGPVILTEANGL